jgi:MlaD protein
MTTAQYPLEWSARLVVGFVRTLTRRRIAVSCIGLVLTMLAAGGYIALGALRVNPTRSTILVRVLLPQSGGLLPDQDVTLRGTPIGRVQSVNFTDTGVVAVAALDAGVSVPDNSMVRVSPLSPAGEQYLDFRPPDNQGPPLTDGSVIGENQTTVPVPLPQLPISSPPSLASSRSAAKDRESWPPSSTAAPSSSPLSIPCCRKPSACCATAPSC